MSFRDWWKRGLSAPTAGGGEACDPKALEMPADCVRPITLQDEIRMLMGAPDLRQQLRNEDVETFEEADDFDIPDEDYSSPWEDIFEPGRIWTRDMEIRAGVVTEPDYKSAQEIVDRAKRVIAQFEFDERGRVKGKKPAPAPKGAGEPASA